MRIFEDLNRKLQQNSSCNKNYLHHSLFNIEKLILTAIKKKNFSENNRRRENEKNKSNQVVSLLQIVAKAHGRRVDGHFWVAPFLWKYKYLYFSFFFLKTTKNSSNSLSGTLQVISSEGYRCPFIGFISSGSCHVLRKVDVPHFNYKLKTVEKRMRQVVIGKLKENESFGEISVALKEPM